MAPAAESPRCHSFCFCCSISREISTIITETPSPAGVQQQTISKRPTTGKDLTGVLETELNLNFKVPRMSHSNGHCGTEARRLRSAAESVSRTSLTVVRRNCWNGETRRPKSVEIQNVTKFKRISTRNTKKVCLGLSFYRIQLR